MGKISQHYMEQIEANHEFNSLVNPHHCNEPEPDYEGELRDYEMDILETAERLLKDAKSLCTQRDLVSRNNTSVTLSGWINQMQSLKGMYCKLLDAQLEREREDYEASKRDYEAMQDVIEEVRADFI